MAKLRRFSATPVAEGVRLEVGKYTVFAVRNEARDVAVRVRREPRRFLRVCMGIPFLRGAVRLLRDIARFFDGLSESAELEPQHPVRGTRLEQAVARALHVRPQTIVTLLSALMLIPIACLCLYAAPMGVSLLLQKYSGFDRLAISMIAALARVVGLMVTVTLTCRLRVLKRLCMYKGAINMVINCYENREEVNAQSVSDYPIYARRSEPAFLLSVLSISLMLFPLLQPIDIVLDALARVGVILLTAALLNEPICALEDARPTPFIRVLRAPIDFMQLMTTLEAHPQMLEVSLCAFNAAMGRAREEMEADDTLDEAASAQSDDI